jgi:cyclic pyranopterin phosphate synthase
MPRGIPSCEEPPEVLGSELLLRFIRMALKHGLRKVRLTGREAGSSRNYRLPGAEGVIGFISPVSNHFCHSCNRLRITAKGKLRPCLFSDLEIDLKEAGSDEEMERLFLCSVRSKPEGRRSGVPLPLEAMSQIGR